MIEILEFQADMNRTRGYLCEEIISLPKLTLMALITRGLSSLILAPPSSFYRASKLQINFKLKKDISPWTKVTTKVYIYWRTRKRDGHFVLKKALKNDFNFFSSLVHIYSNVYFTSKITFKISLIESQLQNCVFQSLGKQETSPCGNFIK